MSASNDLESTEREALSALEAAPSLDALEELRVRILGRKGVVKGLVDRIKDLPAAERGAYGQAVNRLKGAIESAHRSRLEALKLQGEEPQGFFDVTLPGVPPVRGSLHPLARVTAEILETFGKLGFRVARGPEVERPFYNFDALNIAPEHPARDPAENFYLEETAAAAAAGGGGEREPLLLRSQTSTIQIRVLMSQPPPLRVVAPGKVFRPDTVDATHHFQFHQVEGLAVDEGLSFSDLKTCLLLFAKDMFGEDARVRLRPWTFPFTEPSAEMEFLCWVCHGKGCSLCKQMGWVELGGCGMVDPNVFEACGIDSEKYTGFAFGLGIERLTMLRYGIRDIRLFTDNDVRFLEQFE